MKKRECLGFLIDLKIKEKLESIRQEVWEDGEVRHFEDYRDHKERSNISGYHEGHQTRKGYVLRYQYQKPVGQSEPIYKEKFGFYKETVGGGEYTNRNGDASLMWGKETTNLGWHKERVGKRDFYVMRDESIELQVYVAKFNYHFGEYDSWRLGVGYEIPIGEDVHRENFFLSLDEKALGDSLDKMLARDCIERETQRQLPKDIKLRIKP